MMHLKNECQKKRNRNDRKRKKRHSRKPKRRLLNSVRQKKRKLSVRLNKKRPQPKKLKMTLRHHHQHHMVRTGTSTVTALGMYTSVVSRWASLSATRDRKSTRLNSSHVSISYAVFCLKKKKKEY